MKSHRDPGGGEPQIEPSPLADAVSAVARLRDRQDRERWGVDGPGDRNGRNRISGERVRVADHVFRRARQ